MAVAPPPPASGDEPSRPRRDFDEAYASATAPWDIGRPQPAFELLARSGGLIGTVLDAGCGTGEHTLLAATFGHQATGVDTARRAIDLARAKAEERHLDVHFVEWDALRLPDLDEQFDTVLDCGLFHIFDDEDRVRYVESLAGVVRSGGRLHMLCFSEHQPGDWGPRRVTQQEIRTSFAAGWTVDSIGPAVIEITLDPKGARAWQAAISRTSLAG
jgi:SAM-dependent methyltransferase